MYMLNMVIILIVMYCNVVTAIDKIPTYLLRFNTKVRGRCGGSLGHNDSTTNWQYFRSDRLSMRGMPQERQKGEMAPASWASIRRNIDQISWRRLALRRVDCCRPSPGQADLNYCTSISTHQNFQPSRRTLFPDKF